LFEEIELSNYSTTNVSFALSINFDADFVDLFELRGFRREKRGQRYHNSLNCLHRRFFLRVLSQGITAQVRYFHDFYDDKLNGNYYTKPLNFLTYYPQGHNSNDGLATYKLDVLGYRVKLLPV
jgi:glycogen debranching enzyme